MTGEQPTPVPGRTQPEPADEGEPRIVIEPGPTGTGEPTIVVEPGPTGTAILDPSVRGNVIEELVPAS